MKTERQIGSERGISDPDEAGKIQGRRDRGRCAFLILVDSGL